MSGAPESKPGGGGDKPQQIQQQIAIQKTGAAFPISLASGKLTHVKSATIDTIKVAPVVQQQQQTTGINQQHQPTATFRISAAVQPTMNTGQPPHVRVVVPPGALMQQAMIKQIDGTNAGVRTQITAIPARTLSQTSISVTRPVTPTTYIPRAGVTATNIQTQRLATPIRTPTPPTVTGLTSGNFVRGTTVARNTSSPATTVISPTNATWMAATGAGQVQLIRTINPPRQRIITPGHAGTTVATTGVVGVGQPNIATNQNQSGSNNQSGQQTFVATLATVLPPRQQTATLVYSNVSNSQAQQYTPTGTTTQRFTVAAASLAGAGNNPRQMRPIQISNRAFSTTKLGVGGMNTTSISIRAPNLPILTPAINAANSTAGNIQARVSTTGNVNISTNSLTTTRIIQLQQPQPGSTGPPGRLTSNLMLQPIIMTAAGGGKIGIRPSTTVATKVQPSSLTITQLGLGKLTTAQQQQSTISSLQGATITQQPTSMNTSTGVVVSSTGTIVHQQPQTININVSQNQQQQPITQIVSVNQNLSGSAGQIITTQNVPTSANVVPVAIQNSKGTTNVFTGTITPIKTTGTTTPITKVLHQSQHPGITLPSSGQQQITEIITSQSTGHHQPASVFIHTRPSNNVTGQTVTSGSTATVIPVTSGTFLPASGGTFYYESVPANSVSVSTGVLSLTTTTVTSTVSHSQTNATSSTLQTGIVTSIPYSQTPGGTFTVVPSSSTGTAVNRSIGQIQIPISTSGTNSVNVSQIQTVPMRFNAHPSPSINASNSDQTVTVTAQSATANTIIHSSGGQQLLQNQTLQQISSQAVQSGQHHQIITMSQTAQPTGGQIVQSGQQVGTAMLIPVQTSIKLTGAGVGASSPSRSTAITNLGSVNTAFLRKRDNDGSPIRAAKNLQPTILSMSSSSSNINSGNNGNNNIANANSNTAIVTLSTPNIVSLNNRMVSNIIAEQLAASSKERPTSPHSRPGSSGGSTTVSANSSPGVDQQINEELTPINRMGNDSHFNPINELYSYHQNQSTSSGIRRQHHDHHHSQLSSGTPNGTIECTPRKKSRRSTNDSQNSSQQLQQQHQQQQHQQQQQQHQQSQQTQHQQNHNQPNNMIGAATSAINNISNQDKVNNTNVVVVNNKENAKPTEFILKKPRTCNLLDSYKQNWKAANNHFQRYSDVKPREERRPTVMDLANQAYIIQRINGWKIHHLAAQMEDLCETEGQVYETLNKMLKQFEIHGKSTEIDRVSDLIKGNMQRSKIISDGVNDARSQILKIFEHKSHVSDIIHRCASKRNFKKREKP